MTPAISHEPISHQRSRPADRGTFPQILHAEWTKFRTVRSWVTAIVVAALMVPLIAMLTGVSSNQKGAPAVPIGPGGEPVTDAFYFAHQALTGDGSITGSVSAIGSSIPAAPGDLRPGVVPWAKAGFIIKENTRQGSAYAAIMVTSDHGVRMQHDYTGDIAGPAAARWLRLDRSGDVITGYASADGTTWTMVGVVHLTGLGQTVQGGLFVASPPAVTDMGTRGTTSTATFDDLHLQGGWAGGDWTAGQLGADSPSFAGYPGNTSGSLTQTGGRRTVTGAGDIAPATRDALPSSGTLGDILTGTFVALIVMVVVGALFITTEYRTALIRVTLAAGPRRGRILAAKAIVLGGVTFVAGLAGTAIAGPLGESLARAHGVYVFPVPAATELRAALGSGALLAAASVLALAAGTIFRHSAAAVTTVIAVIVLPYLLIANPFMPATGSAWLARVTPAAAFAVQQTLVRYHQVSAHYTAYNGYYPLAPWAGLAVLAGYALAGLAIATVAIRRRDA